jgi:UDP-3-O-[3-hydroxymyristoyl] glucosamine N-acyltransferase LpxD
VSNEFLLRDFVEPRELIQSGSFTHFDDPQAIKPSALAFCEDLENLYRAMQNPNVSAILALRRDLDRVGGQPTVGTAAVDHPRAVYWRAFVSLVKRGLIFPEMKFGRGSGCRIHPSASVSEKVWLGDDVTIEAQASIGDYCIIGAASNIGPGARIGADGLQSVNIAERKLFIGHAGGVRLGERVVVLANAVISRAVHPVFTTVGDDTHLSLLSSIGHQSEVGKRCSIAGNCLIGGSAKLGDDVVIGPSVTVKDGIRIGDNARIRLGSVVIEDVPDNGDVSGNFAINHVTNLRSYVRTRNEAR